MTACNSDGGRCGNSDIRANYFRTVNTDGSSWIDRSFRCSACGAGWVRRMNEGDLSE